MMHMVADWTLTGGMLALQNAEADNLFGADVEDIWCAAQIAQHTCSVTLAA